MRDDTGLFQADPPAARPTFHEIWSLGIALYENRGIDAQLLAGHTRRTMTEQYKSGHDQDWTNARALLNVSELL